MKRKDQVTHAAMGALAGACFGFGLARLVEGQPWFALLLIPAAGVFTVMIIRVHRANQRWRDQLHRHLDAILVGAAGGDHVHQPGCYTKNGPDQG